MSSKDLKYEGASVKDFEGNIIVPYLSVEFLNKVRKNNYREYNEKYENHLYCPECHKPRLLLAHYKESNDFYLKGYPNQSHDKDCSYSFETINQKAFDEFLSDPKSREFINGKLNKLIEKVIGDTISNVPFLVKENEGKISTEQIENVQNIENIRNIKRLPIKMITSPLHEDDYNVPKLFYGNVDIWFEKEYRKSDNTPFYSMNICRVNTKNIICSIGMSKNIFPYLNLPQSNKVDFGNKYNNIAIAFATTLVKNGKYTNGSIPHSDYCVIVGI